MGKIHLAELITKVIKFKRNTYWRMGWRLKYHTGMYGPQDRKISLVRRYF